MHTIYLDNAATTRLRESALEAMMPYLKGEYGNPSSIYPLAHRSEKAVEDCRATIADTLGADPREIFFTGGGSESDNWALKGIASSLRGKGRHIVTSAIEHHAILHTCAYLESLGFEVTYLPVDADGLVDPHEFEQALRTDTILASIMMANNEIGTVEPIAELGRIAHEHGVLFHTDAVQAYGHLPINVKELGIDLLSASSHKIGGPKGIGLLYKRRGVKIDSLIHGGQQEQGKRAGTENVAGIVGFAQAAEEIHGSLQEESKRLAGLRDYAIARILDEVPYARLNGSASKRLPNNVNISFDFIEGEGMLLQLAAAGICASSGSACTSGSLDPSHVLLAIGLPHEKAHGSIRLTLGPDTTLEDIDFTVTRLRETVANLRAMSPLFEDFTRTTKQAC